MEKRSISRSAISQDFSHDFKKRILRDFLQIDSSGSQLPLFSATLALSYCTFSYSSVRYSTHSYSYSQKLYSQPLLLSATCTDSYSTLSYSYSQLLSHTLPSTTLLSASQLLYLFDVFVLIYVCFVVIYAEKRMR